MHRVHPGYITVIHELILDKVHISENAVNILNSLENASTSKAWQFLIYVINTIFIPILDIIFKYNFFFFFF